MTSKRWDTIAAVAWLTDDALLVSGAEAAKPNFQIWRVSASDGAVRRVTNDLNTYQDITVASATHVVATVLGDVSSTISIGSPSDPAAQASVTSGIGRYDGQLGLAWTPGGRVVFTSAAGGQTDLWIFNFAWSRDGRLAVAHGPVPTDVVLLSGIQ